MPKQFQTPVTQMKQIFVNRLHRARRRVIVQMIESPDDVDALVAKVLRNKKTALDNASRQS
jgi:hypothetical protein